MNAEQLEEIKRHFSVVSEVLRSDIRRMAECDATFRHESQEPHEEICDEFKTMRTFARLSFSQLKPHVRTLETDISDLKNRIDHLEISQA
jgi:hypothetical protein